jgi:hypothetical protein
MRKAFELAAYNPSKDRDGSSAKKIMELVKTVFS